MKTPLPATPLSFEKLNTGTFAARAIGEGMTRYLSALPEALYALFGTGYLGYTAARQWGKVKGVDQ